MNKIVFLLCIRMWHKTTAPDTHIHTLIHTLIHGSSVTNVIYKFVTFDLSCRLFCCCCGALSGMKRNKKIKHKNHLPKSVAFHTVWTKQSSCILYFGLNVRSVYWLDVKMSIHNTTAWCFASFNYDKLALNVCLLRSVLFYSMQFSKGTYVHHIHIYECKTFTQNFIDNEVVTIFFSFSSFLFCCEI